MRLETRPPAPAGSQETPYHPAQHSAAASAADGSQVRRRPRGSAVMAALNARSAARSAGWHDALHCSEKQKQKRERRLNWMEKMQGMKLFPMKVAASVKRLVVSIEVELGERIFFLV